MCFDSTKPDSGDYPGITGDFVSNMENRIKGLSINEDPEVAFRALYEETRDAIQKLENALKK